MAVFQMSNTSIQNLAMPAVMMDPELRREFQRDIDRVNTKIEYLLIRLRNAQIHVNDVMENFVYGEMERQKSGQTARRARRARAVEAC